MIDIPAILTANGIGVALTLILLLSVQGKHRMRLLGEKLFIAMTLLTMLLCIIEASSFCIDGHIFPGSRAVNLVANALCYSLNMAFCIVWNLYVDYTLFESVSHMRSCLVRIMAPALMVVILAIVSIFVPVIFSVSDENVYARTGISWVCFAITYGYLFYSVLKVAYYRRKIEKYLLLPVSVFMIPIVIGSMLQYIFYGLSLTWVACSVALVTLYINIQDQANAIDTLSGLFSRSYMMSYLNDIVEHARTGQLYAGLMLDIDRFKDINDTYGHAVGDDAITKAGTILRSAVGKQVFVARYAGDEFVIVAPVKTPADADVLVREVEASAAGFDGRSKEGYTLRFSIGSTVFKPGEDTVETFLKRMDDAMYEQKATWGREHDRRHTR